MEAGNPARVPAEGTTPPSRSVADPLSLSDLNPEFFSSSAQSLFPVVSGEQPPVRSFTETCGRARSAGFPGGSSVGAGDLLSSPACCTEAAPRPQSFSLPRVSSDGNSAPCGGSGKQQGLKGCVSLSSSSCTSPPDLVSSRTGVTRVMRPAVLHPLQHGGEQNTSSAPRLLPKEPGGGRKNPAVRRGMTDPFASLGTYPLPGSPATARGRGDSSSPGMGRTEERTDSAERLSSRQSPSLGASRADSSVASFVSARASDSSGSCSNPCTSSLTVLPACSRLVFPAAFSAVPPHLPPSLQHRWRVCVYRHLFLVYPHPSIWASSQSPSSSAAPSFLPDSRSSLSSRCLPPPQVSCPFSRDLSLPCLFIDRRSGSLNQRLLPLRTGFLLQQVAPRVAAAAMSAGELSEADTEPPASFGHFHLALDSDALLGTLAVGGRRYLVLVTESEPVADFEEKEPSALVACGSKTNVFNKDVDATANATSALGSGDDKWSRRVVKVVKRAVCLPYHVKSSVMSVKRDIATVAAAEVSAAAAAGRKGTPASAGAVVRGFAATEPKRQLSARKLATLCPAQDKLSAIPSCSSSPCFSPSSSFSSSASSSSANNEGPATLELQCAASRPDLPVLDLTGRKSETRNQEDDMGEPSDGLSFSELDRTPRREDPGERKAGVPYEGPTGKTSPDGCRPGATSVSSATATELATPGQPSQVESIAGSLFSGRMAIGGLVSAAADSLGGALGEGGKSTSMTQWVSQQLSLAQGAANPLINRWLGEGGPTGAAAGEEGVAGGTNSQGEETGAFSGRSFFPGLVVGATGQAGEHAANRRGEGDEGVRRAEAEGFMGGLAGGIGGSRWPFGLSELAAAAGQVTADLMNGANAGGEGGQSRLEEGRSSSHPPPSDFFLRDGSFGLTPSVISSPLLSSPVKQPSSSNGASNLSSSSTALSSSLAVASVAVVASDVPVRNPVDPSPTPTLSPTVVVTSVASTTTEDLSAAAEADRYAAAVEKLLCSCCYYSYDLELTRSLQNLEELGVSISRQKLPGYAESPEGGAVAFWGDDDGGGGGTSGEVNEANRIRRRSREGEVDRRGSQGEREPAEGGVVDRSGGAGGEHNSLYYDWKGAGLIAVADRRFTWNVQLYREWEAAGLDQRWMVPLIQGYVGYVRLESTSSPSSVSPHHRLAPARSLGTVAFRRQLSSASCASGSARGAEKDEDTGSFLVRSVELLLICRRSSKRGGTRYNARGIDDEGNVANFAESEQRVRLMAYTVPSSLVSTPGLQASAADALLASAGTRCAETLGRWASLVQVRGSVPVFWEQTGLTAQTAVTRNTILTTTAFEKHQEDLFRRYGPVVCYVDLLSGSRTNEARLVAALEQQIAAYEHDHPRAPGIQHVHYDFHQQVKSKAYEAALGEFVETRLLDAAAAIEFYLEPSREYRGRRQARLVKKEEDGDRPSAGNSEAARSGRDRIGQGAPGSSARRAAADEAEVRDEETEKRQGEAGERGHKQRGVLRTNCLDCLDRTNVFQWYFCWFWLNQHLRANHFDSFLLPVKRRRSRLLCASSADLITCSAASSCHGVSNLSGPFFRSSSFAGRSGNLVLCVGGGGFPSNSGASGGLGVHHRTKIRSRSSSLRNSRSSSAAGVGGCGGRGAEGSERANTKGSGGGLASLASSGGRKGWQKNSIGMHLYDSWVPSSAGEGRDRWHVGDGSEEVGGTKAAARGRGGVPGGDVLEEEVSVLREEVKRIWADQGDSISLLYTGTGSVFTSHMRQGGKATFSSNLDHALKALGRFYQNTFEDTYRQEVIDVFLGLHRLSVSATSLTDSGSSESSSRRTALLVGRRTTTHAMKLASQRQLELFSPRQWSSASSAVCSGTRRQSSGDLQLQSTTSFLRSTLAEPSASLEMSSTHRDSSVGEAIADTVGISDASRDDTTSKADREAAAPVPVGGSREEAAGPKATQRAVEAAGRRIAGDQAEQVRGRGEAGARDEGGGGSMLPLRVWVGTWNLAGRDLHEWEDIEEWLTPVKQQADLYVFCIQELVELTGFRVLMNLKDTEKEARLEQKAAAALNNLAHHFPKPPFAASRQQRLSRAVVSQEPLCRAAEEGLRSSGSAVSSSSSFVSCTGWGREEDSTSRKGTGDSDSRKIDEEGGIFGFFKRDSELSSRLPRSLSTRRGGADSGWDVEAVGREQTERGVPASPGRGVERFKLSSYSQAPTFVKVRSCSMVGLMILVFIRTELKNLLAGVEVSAVKVGLKGNAGNKGAVGVSLRMGLTSFCFLNVHLASGQGSSHERMQQMSQVLQQAFQAGPAYTANALEHDYAVVAGDFNFRLVANHQQVVGALNHPKSALLGLLKLDQFYISQRHSLPPFFHFHEAPIEFQPTYKYKRNSSHYDFKRTPAWCDRILYCGRRVPARPSFCPLSADPDDQVTDESSSPSTSCPRGGSCHAETGDKDGFRSSSATAASFFRDSSACHSAKKASPEDDCLPPPCHPLTVLSYTDHPRYFSSDHKPVSLVFTCSVCIPGLLDLSTAASTRGFSKPTSGLPSGLGRAGSRTLKRPPFLPPASSLGGGDGNGSVPAEVLAPRREHRVEGADMAIPSVAKSKSLFDERRTTTASSDKLLGEDRERDGVKRVTDDWARESQASEPLASGVLHTSSEETAPRAQWGEGGGSSEGMEGSCTDGLKKAQARRSQEGERERKADQEESSEDGAGDIPTDLSDNEDDEAIVTLHGGGAPRRKGRQGREAAAATHCARKSQLHLDSITTHHGTLPPSVDLLDMDVCEAPPSTGERGYSSRGEVREGACKAGEGREEGEGTGLLECEQSVGGEGEKVPWRRTAAPRADPQGGSGVSSSEEGTCTFRHRGESPQHSRAEDEASARRSPFLSVDLLEDIPSANRRDRNFLGQCESEGSVDLMGNFESSLLQNGGPDSGAFLRDDHSRRADQLLPQRHGPLGLPMQERTSLAENDNGNVLLPDTSGGLEAAEPERRSGITGRLEGEGESVRQLEQWSLLDFDGLGTKPDCPAPSVERVRQDSQTPACFDDLLS